jgi:hypothetical protein
MTARKQQSFFINDSANEFGDTGMAVMRGSMPFSKRDVQGFSNSN